MMRCIPRWHAGDTVVAAEDGAAGEDGDEVGMQRKADADVVDSEAEGGVDAAECNGLLLHEDEDDDDVAICGCCCRVT